jgi:hypothetical protein
VCDGKFVRDTLSCSVLRKAVLLLVLHTVDDVAAVEPVTDVGDNDDDDDDGKLVNDTLSCILLTPPFLTAKPDVPAALGVGAVSETLSL